MPDPSLIAQALAAALFVASAVAALVVLPSFRRGRTAETRESGRWPAVVLTLSVALGFYAACWRLGLRVHWPPRDDQARLLALIFPAVVLVECIAAWLVTPRFAPGRSAPVTSHKGRGYLAWLLRTAMVAGAAWGLLYGSSYLSDAAGPGTSEWSWSTAVLILVCETAAVVLVWWLLDTLARRSGSGSTQLALAIVAAGAGATVMLSGYTSAGQMGLAIGAALAGVGAIMAILRRASCGGLGGGLGVGMVGLFAVLAMGRFFGTLSTWRAIGLLAAPLLAWVPELAAPRKMPPWLRGMIGCLLSAIAATLILFGAYRAFVEASGSPTEPSVDDYLQFGAP